MRPSLIAVFLSLLWASVACAYQTPLVQPAAFWIGQTAASSGGGGGDPTVGLLPTDRDFYANWKMAGLLSTGGIPSGSWTQCGSTVAATNTTADLANINNAIAACTANHYVLLGSGTFNLNSGTLALNKSGVVLRGQGAASTTLTITNGATIGSFVPGAHNAPLISMGGSGSVSNTTTLSADAAQGSYTIQVSSATGFAVGDLVLVDELAISQAMPDCCFNNGTGQVWAEPDYRVEWNVHNPAVGSFDNSNCFTPWGGTANNFSCDTNGDACAYSIRCGGVNEELHLVTGVSGTTITFDSPLTLSYRTANTAQARVYSTSQFITNAGIESMKLSFGDNANIAIQGCVGCWVKNVESLDWLNGGVAMTAAVFRNQIEGNYIHNAVWPVNGGAGYGIMQTFGGSENLVWNNIVLNVNKVEVVRASGSGDVFAYNYMDDGYIGGNTWAETGLNCSHLIGSHGCLFEGNLSFNTDNDFTHGSTNHVVYFRNQLTGLRAPYVDTTNSTTYNDAAGTPSGCCGPLRAIGDHPYSYWNSWVGNVAGRSGYSYSAWTQRCATGNADSGCAPAIYNLGWNDTSVAGSLADGLMALTYPASYTGTITGAAGSFATNPTPILDGNYDYKSGTTQWASYDTAHTLPNSFFLASAPSFFGPGATCTYNWPQVTPETGTPVQGVGGGGSCSSYRGLPAAARIDAGTPFGQP